MIIKQINLKDDCPDEVYTGLCETTQKQGVFKACGNLDEKWVMVQFESLVDYFAWTLAMFGESKEIDITDGE